MVAVYLILLHTKKIENTISEGSFQLSTSIIPNTHAIVAVQWVPLLGIISQDLHSSSEISELKKWVWLAEKAINFPKIQRHTMLQVFFPMDLNIWTFYWFLLLLLTFFFWNAWSISSVNIAFQLTYLVSYTYKSKSHVHFFVCFIYNFPYIRMDKNKLHRFSNENIKTIRLSNSDNDLMSFWSRWDYLKISSFDPCCSQ